MRVQYTRGHGANCHIKIGTDRYLGYRLSVVKVKGLDAVTMVIRCSLDTERN